MMASGPNSHWQLVPEQSESESDQEITSLPMRPRSKRKDHSMIRVLSKGTDMSHAWCATQSRLLLLPAEIRSLIYSYALSTPTRWSIRHSLTCQYASKDGEATEDIPWLYSSNDPSRCACISSHRRPSLSLLLTCRQTRTEATPLYFQLNNTCIYLPSSPDEVITDMRDLRDPIASNIRHLSILLEPQSLLFPVTTGYSDYFHAHSWAVILNLKHLQTLTLPYEIFTVEGTSAFTRITIGALNILAALRPCFRQLKATSLLRIEAAETDAEVVMTLSTVVALPLTQESLKAQMAVFGNMRWRCVEVAETMGGVDEFLAWSGESGRVRPRERWRLDLGQGTTQWVRLEERREQVKADKVWEAMHAAKVSQWDEEMRTVERLDRIQALQSEEERVERKQKSKVNRNRRKQQETERRERKRVQS